MEPALIWKATAILLAAAAVSLALRRAPAALRHLVWTTALAGALLIPVLSFALPRWTVPVWRDVPILFRATATAHAPAAPAPERAASALPPKSQPLPRTIPFGAIWLAGAALLLVPPAVSRIALARLARAAMPARPGLCEAMSIPGRIRLLEIAAPISPVTWGVLRPVILIPQVAAEGDPARLRAILTHELAHIARGDCLWQLLGQLACALYWFHPLVWLAHREALRLRERAADDTVLRSGVRASDYAGDLLCLARTLASPRLCGSLAIARPSSLESRVRAILDPTVRRAAQSRAILATGLSAAALAIFVIAAARPASAGSPESLDEAAAQLRSELQARKARSGEDSLDYARGLGSLCALYAEWDRTDLASEYCAAALPALEKHLGPSDPALFEPLHYLAVDAHARKDWPRAASLYQRALATGPAAPRAALVTAELAIATLGAGDSARAEQLADQAAALAPQGSLESAAALAAQARVLRELGRTADADRISAQAQQARDAWSASRTAPPAPVEPGTYRIGPGISAPVPLEKHEPEYSAEARINKYEGTCVLAMLIGADGHPRSVRVTRPLGMGLDQKALEAVRQWRFTPGMKDGEPVVIRATVEVNFRLL
ncbi:MAG: TonB family protein [Acidobacteriota bacterium]